MKSKVTSAIILDTRREKANHKYPIKIRLTYQRKRKYYATGFDVDKNEWNNVNSFNPKGKLRKIKNETHKLLARVDETISQIRNFSFMEFEERFFNSASDDTDVFEAYDRYIDRLGKEEREGTKENYLNSKSSLKRFESRLSFYDITPELLKKYEKWMFEEGNSLSTVGIYLRPLRALMNKAIDDKVISEDIYPFKKGKYVIPVGVKGKVALSAEEVGLIYRYQSTPYSMEDRSKDFWLFSYFCNGMNFKDIFNLKYHQLLNDSFTFEREKTKLTRRENPIIIEVMLNDYITEIIDKWGNKNRNPDNFIFPYVNTEPNSELMVKARRQFIKVTNTHMKNICAKVGISKKVTTYVARHSFSYVMLNSGGSIEHLCECLGHSDIKTTQNYTSNGIAKETKKKLAQNLYKF